MCSVGFNNSFGMNIKNPQELQKKHFGANVRTSGGSSQASFNPDTSIFKMNAAQMRGNPFSNSALNSSNMLQQSRMEKAAALWDKADAEILKSFETGAGKGGIRTLTLPTKSGTVNSKNNTSSTHHVRTNNKQGVQAGNAVNDVKNANSKSSLTDALGVLTQLGSLAKSVVSLIEGNKKATETKEKSAEAKVDKSGQQVKNDKQQLEKNKASLNDANNRVSNAETRLNNAAKGVTSAEQKLAQAKAAATDDNPNTAAIAQAEAELEAAKQEEQAAQQELQAAKEEQTQAQQAVDSQSQQVEQSEQQHEQDKAALDNAQKEVADVDAQVQQNQSEGEKIDDGIAEGEKKLSDIENNQENVAGEEGVPMSGGDANDESVTSDPNAPKNAYAKTKYDANNSLIENGGYSAEQKQAMYDARENIKNMKPGDSVQCGADIYTMDENGKVSVNGQEFELQGYDNPQDAIEVIAENGVSSVMTKADSDKINDAMDRANGVAPHNSSTPVKSNNSQAQTVPSDQTQVKTAQQPQNTAPAGDEKSVEQKEDAPKADSTQASTSKSVKDTRLVERNGQYIVNGHLVSKEQFELAKGMDDEVLQAGFTPTSDCEIVLEDGTSKNFFIHNGKYTIDGKEVDAKQFMAEYNEMKEKSDSSRIDSYSYCKENADGTMVLPNMGGNITIDSSGNVLKEFRKNGGVNSGNVTFDAREKTKTTDIDSMIGSRFNHVAVMQDMEDNGSVIQDKDGNVLATFKDGDYYDAKGKKMKDNGIEKLIKKHEGQGLKLVGKLTTSRAGAWV